jgi:hypothetical protein
LIAGAWIFFTTPDTTVRIRTIFEVGERTGINLDSNALYLGKGLAGSILERQFTVQNPFNAPVDVSTECRGMGCEWIRIAPATFAHGPGETVTLTVTVTIPPHAPTGHFETGIDMRFYRHKWDLIAPRPE